jgi:hypothetical protein
MTRRPRSSAERKAQASRAAERKRESRGGYKNIDRQYEQLMASLPEEKQQIAKSFYEYAIDGRKISLSPSGRRTQRQLLNAEADRQTVAFFERLPSEELDSFIARLPEDDRERARPKYAQRISRLQNA